MLSSLRCTARRAIAITTRSLSNVATVTSNQVPPTLAAKSVPLPFATPTAPPPMLDIPPAEDPLLQFMANTIMRHGKRKRASRIVSRMLLWVHSLTRAPPLDIVRQAVLLAAPAVRIMSHTHGGKIVARPVALSEKQRTRYAVKWIIKACENRPGQTLEERLAREIIATLQGSSSVLTEKDRLHTLAMVNRCVPADGLTVSYLIPVIGGTLGHEFRATKDLYYYHTHAYISLEYTFLKNAERIPHAAAP
jgi:small subunit ribosomal protein S7